MIEWNPWVLLGLVMILAGLSVPVMAYAMAWLGLVDKWWRRKEDD